MKRLLRKKAKKSPKPPKQNLALGIPANTVVRPLGFRAELDIVPEGDPLKTWEYIDLIRPQH